MLIEITILIALLALVLYKSTLKPSGLPPGTFGLPIIGSLPPRNFRITHHFADLKKKYGNIFTTKWGSRVIVVLADISLIKKAMNHPDFQGRPDFYTFNLMSNFGNFGLISSNGKIWNDNRHFMIRHLRDLGMGKTHLGNTIQMEAEMLVDYLEKTSLDKLTEIDRSINVAVSNVIWLLLANKRYKADDQEIVEYIQMVQDGLEILQGPIFMINFMPWFAKVLPKFITNGILKSNVIESHLQQFFKLCKKTIKEHEESLDPDNPRDVIDYYLLEMEATKNDPETTFTEARENLFILMGDMFAAGSDTTSSTLRWVILYMAIRPDIQSEVHRAIDEIVPKDRLPSLDDRQQLPYVDAMVLDVLRLSSLVPTSVPHEATETVHFEEYIIPKGTILLPCLELCHKDAALWEKPDDLCPEHFLDDQGNLDSKKEAFMPFSIGRRKCLGESLARMELFLFAAAILQRFTIVGPPGVQLLVEFDPNQKLMNVPKPFKVILKKRI